MEKGTMLEALYRAEDKLRPLLSRVENWNTLDVNYEPPRVERLWHQLDEDHRLFLHRIHPCEKALFHPHPWPSAVRIISGRYEMGIGYQPHEDWPEDESPPIAATLMLTCGSEYEMIDPMGWHYVKPHAVPSLSVMVTGPRWDRWSPSPPTKQGPLKDEVRDELLGVFRQLYGFK